MESTVYRIKSDVATVCHCGHEVKSEEKYVMLRSSAIRWISLCDECVRLISSPVEMDMKELVKYFFESRPSDGRMEERAEGTIKPKKMGALSNRIAQKNREEELKAEWI